jgi:hypothetical protein
MAHLSQVRICPYKSNTNEANLSCQLEFCGGFPVVDPIIWREPKRPRPAALRRRLLGGNEAGRFAAEVKKVAGIPGSYLRISMW